MCAATASAWLCLGSEAYGQEAVAAEGRGAPSDRSATHMLEPLFLMLQLARGATADVFSGADPDTAALARAGVLVAWPPDVAGAGLRPAAEVAQDLPGAQAAQLGEDLVALLELFCPHWAQSLRDRFARAGREAFASAVRRRLTAQEVDALRASLVVRCRDRYAWIRLPAGFDDSEARLQWEIENWGEREPSDQVTETVLQQFRALADLVEGSLMQRAGDEPGTEELVRRSRADALAQAEALLRDPLSPALKRAATAEEYARAETLTERSIRSDPWLGEGLHGRAQTDPQKRWLAARVRRAFVDVVSQLASATEPPHSGAMRQALERVGEEIRGRAAQFREERAGSFTGGGIWPVEGMNREGDQRLMYMLESVVLILRAAEGPAAHLPGPAGGPAGSLPPQHKGGT